MYPKGGVGTLDRTTPCPTERLSVNIDKGGRPNSGVNLIPAFPITLPRVVRRDTFIYTDTAVFQFGPISVKVEFVN
jgi:hypothetical protein